MHSASTRWASVLAVLVAAPWFAEFSWGGYPLEYLPIALLFVGPMYGGAALLIREAAVRTGRGWPMILLLAAAFGVLQAGLVDQSLFNPAYGRFDFQHPAHVAGIDISLYYLVAFVSGHVVASIVAPLVLVGAWSRHPAEPWLSRRGLWVIAILYAVSTVVNFFGVKDEDGDGFQAAPLQVGTAAATVLLLIGAAVLWRKRSSTDVRVPGPWVLVVLGFVAYLLYLPGESTAALVVGLVVIAVVIAAVGRWSRSVRWSASHAFALAMGTVLVGTVMPFLVEPYDDTVGRGSELVADSAAAALCLTIVAITTRRHIRSRSSGHIRSRGSGHIRSRSSFGISKSPWPPA